MNKQARVKLIKRMSYERIDCTCGIAVFTKDPTPEATESVKELAKKHNLTFTLVDANAYPEILDTYKIKQLPAVIINEQVYPVDEKMLKDALENK